MSESTREQPPQTGGALDETSEYGESPGLVDGIRFLYLQRLRLVTYFLVLFGLGALAYAVAYLLSPRVVQGIVGLDFHGIERHQYPSGRKFSVEDFRSPDVIKRALEDAGIPAEALGVRALAASVAVTPVIPSEIQTRWKKQDRDGVRHDEYYPNEFEISIELHSMDRLRALRLFDAVVKSYRQRVKFDQNAALEFVASWSASYEELATTYDFWDVPGLFRRTFNAMSAQLENVITESLQAADPAYQLAFRQIQEQLRTWEATRLMAIEALTYQGRLVRNREVTERRIAYQIEDLDIRIKQKADETAEAMKLLEVAERPRATLAGSLSNQGGMPVIDANALDRLVKADYVGPVVERISRLQEETQEMQAAKARLQQQLTLLPKAANTTLEQLPAGYKALVGALSSELQQIVDAFNTKLDEYLTANVTNLVSVRRAPMVGRAAYSPTLMLAALFVFSAFLAIVALALENVIRKIRAEAK